MKFKCPNYISLQFIASTILNKWLVQQSCGLRKYYISFLLFFLHHSYLFLKECNFPLLGILYKPSYNFFLQILFCLIRICIGYNEMSMILLTKSTIFGVRENVDFSFFPLCCFHGGDSLPNSGEDYASEVVMQVLESDVLVLPMKGGVLPSYFLMSDHFSCNFKIS